MWRISAIVIAAIGSAGCAGGPDTYTAYDGPTLAPGETATLTFKPWWEMGSIVAVSAGNVTYFDTRRDHNPGTYESGWHEVHVALRPGEYEVQTRGRCMRHLPVERTDRVTLEAGHRYRMDGGGCMSGDVRLWIEDTTSGRVIAGSKDHARSAGRDSDANHETE